MFRKFNPLLSESKSFSWWWLGLKIGIISALIVWWWLDQQNKKPLNQTSNSTTLDKEKSIPLPDEAPTISGETSHRQPTLSKPDDLRKIEGIGPKIQTTLQAAGIETFKKLASANPAELKQILVDAGIRIGYPETWPEQAALAANAEWDALTEFQDTLQGGRRIT